MNAINTLIFYTMLHLLATTLGFNKQVEINHGFHGSYSKYDAMENDYYQLCPSYILSVPSSNIIRVSLTTATYYIVRDILKTIKNNHHPRKLVLLYLFAILLAQSCVPEPNPGPRTPRYPCGICAKAVTWKTPAVCCDTCNTCYHKNCMGMNTLVYQGLHNVSWECDTCGLPNLPSCLFDTTSIETLNRFETFNTSSSSFIDIGSQSAASSPLDKTPVRPIRKRFNTPVRIIVVNCQSIRNKKHEL